MNNEERTVTVSAAEYGALCAEAEDARLLKIWLGRKNRRYAGVDHREIDDLCAMFGIEEKEG